MNEPSTSQIAEDSYRHLQYSRILLGVARLQMGVELCTLKDTDGWRGRCAANSFRRFLQEEGLDPKAVHMYMTAARAFVMDHKVDPKEIAMVSMTLLAEMAPHVNFQNLEEVVGILTSMPAVEARVQLRSFMANGWEKPARREKAVTDILQDVDALPMDHRAELFANLGLRSRAMAAGRPAHH